MLIFLDLETTGLEADDRICSIAVILEDDDTVKVEQSLVRPTCKIRPEAMAVHHITNERVASAPLFSDSETAALLQQYNSTDSVLVGHNISFDLSMLAKEGLIWQGGFIDTLRCSRHLIEETDRFSLQFLRYELGLYRSEQGPANALGVALVAHDALSDAFQVKRLYGYLSTMADDETLMQLSITPVLIKKFLFGKYRDRYVEEVATHDPGYLHWLLGQEPDEDLEHTLKHYL